MLAVALSLALAVATPAPSGGGGASSASAPADPAILQRAKDTFSDLASGNLDRSSFNDDANMTLDVDTVKGMTAQLAPLGAPVSFVQTDASPIQGSTAYTFLLTFKNGTKLDFLMILDASGKIAGLQLQPGA